MPDQLAMPVPPFSQPYKGCQRALAQWLDQRPGGTASVAATRHALQSLSAGEYRQLLSWLRILDRAARDNGDTAMAARIERLTAHLGGRSRPRDTSVNPPCAVHVADPVFSVGRV